MAARLTRSWWIACALALLVGAAAGAWALREPEPPPAWGEIFAAHLGEGRWFPGRSTLELPYRPERPRRALTHDESQRLHAELILRGQRDPAGLRRARALFYLWRSEPGDVERARAELEAMPEGAARWNELALVELQAGDDLLALEYVERAYELDPRAPAILFNRALLLRRQLLLQQAQEAFAELLATEPTGPWAEEARRLRDDAAPAPAADELERVREFLWSTIWRVRNRADLAAFDVHGPFQRYLDQMAANGEPGLLAEVRWMRTLAADAWKDVGRMRGRAQEVYADMWAGRPIDRNELLAWSRGPSPQTAVRAAAWLLWDAFQRADYAAADRSGALLLRLCEERGFPELCALAHSDLALVRQSRGDYQGAAAAYSSALELLPPGTSSRRAELLRKRAGLAASMEAFGDAARFCREALVMGTRRTDPLPLYQLSLYAKRLGAPRASLQYSLESWKVARIHGPRVDEMRAARSTAVLFAALGRREEALRILDQQLAASSALDMDAAKLGLLSSKAALLIDAGRLEAAESVLGSLQRELQGRDFRTQEREAFELRGRLLAARGDRSGAIAALRKALERAPRRAEEFGKLANVRIDAESGPLRTGLARLLALEGRGHEAWPILAGPPRAMERGECAVFYGRVRDRIGIWTLAGGDARYDEVGAAEDLSSAEILAAVGAPYGNDRCPESTSRLVVIENPSSLVGLGTRLSRLSRPDVPVVVARRASQPWPARRATGPALVVHSPAPILHDVPVPPLPHAREEAARVAARLPHTRLLGGGEATPAAVKAVASDFGVLHFAVHGESLDGAGAASYLLLAGELGRLQVADILELDLSRRRPLVVLSACRGGGSAGNRERDGAGLPWALLEAGASVVVATEDAIEDRAALEFSEAFYAELAAGRDVVTAFESGVQHLRGRWTIGVASGYNLYI